ALEQQTATAEMLKVISRSTTDVMPVFEAIVRSARDLGEAGNAYAFRYDGEKIHYITGTSTNPEWLRLMQTRPPWPPDKSGLTGRVVLANSSVQIEDITTDDDYDPESRRVASGRKLLGVPMLRDGKAIGVLTVSWDEPGSVPGKFVRLLETFAAQAVIA